MPGKYKYIYIFTFLSENNPYCLIGIDGSWNQHYTGIKSYCFDFFYTYFHYWEFSKDSSIYINSLKLSDAHMCQWSNQHWFR